jgi:hypothetical protein
MAPEAVNSLKKICNFGESDKHCPCTVADEQTRLIATLILLMPRHFGLYLTILLAILKYRRHILPPIVIL